ncbi:MAG: phosphoenolpyruvate--protein phosphotransferase, partial [Saezia sp.]
LLKQFSEMENEYFQQRGTDVEQIINRLQKALHAQKQLPDTNFEIDSFSQRSGSFIVVAHDITIADMLYFKQTSCTGFILDTGGLTSHNAIIARSMSLSALFGAQHASQLIHQDDLLIIDGLHGTVMVNPSAQVLQEYQNLQKQNEQEQERLSCLRDTPSRTLDGQNIELLANIDIPEDSVNAKETAAAGVGLFRTEFLFIAHTEEQSKLPDEDEQYHAYATVLKTMPKQPVVIRTIDIRADKSFELDNTITPSTGATLFRTNLIVPDIFQIQLRALLRAATHGQLHILIPMLSHEFQIHQVFVLIEKARTSLQAKGIPYGEVKIGAMIETPAAVITLPLFLEYFDFFSIGTNDLTQYTLAVDRTDESVAHLFDNQHPAVLQLIATTIAQCNAAGKKVSLCGEMAGDTSMTRLLLGLGLRSFSMHPAQILAVKNEVLHSNIQKLTPLAKNVICARNKLEQTIALKALQKA